jgi:hypothetical protein
MELLHQHLTRQIDLIPIDNLAMPVRIVGAGAIGSFLTLQLVKMGFNDVEVWDFDTVSIENMSCQFYRFKDIGKPKVAALKEIIQDFTGVDITVHNMKFEPRADLRGVVVLAVDDMVARTAIWTTISNLCFQVRMVIDSRMGSESALMYVMNPFDDKDKAAYANTLYSNEDAVQERCTAKATIYTVNLLSGMVAKAIKNLACKENYPRVTQWSIKDDQCQQWRKEGNR